MDHYGLMGDNKALRMSRMCLISEFSYFFFCKFLVVVKIVTFVDRKSNEAFMYKKSRENAVRYCNRSNGSHGKLSNQAKSESHCLS